MFKAFRIAVLLTTLILVAFGTWLTQTRSTDWNNSLWVKIYPINADGSPEASKYIDNLKERQFLGIEEFLAREAARYGRDLDDPVRMELGSEIREQPPALPETGNVLSIMWWSLRMRWWSSSVTDAQDRIEPDVRIFVRYHKPQYNIRLENSVGLQKGMVGIVNGYAGRAHGGTNNVIIAHEFLHTLGASDKYDRENGQPIPPDGLADPDRKPLYPQSRAEIMGGRIARSRTDAVIPNNLKSVIIGPQTAREINLIE